jgi:hypothetical protein
VASVTRNDIDGFMHDIATGNTASRQKTKLRGLSVVRGGRGVASRIVGLLDAILTYAVREGLRFDNWAHGIVRFADGRRQRRAGASILPMPCCWQQPMPWAMPQ